MEGDGEGDRISQDQMQRIDKLYWTPAERATGVLNLINQVREQLKEQGHEIPSDWDLLCFCIEFMGQQAIAIGDDDFLRLAMLSSQWLYSAHYSNPGRIYGEPDKLLDDSKEHDEGEGGNVQNED